MFRHYMSTVLVASLVAVVAACHPAVQVQTPRSAAVECVDARTAPATSDRQVVGFARTSADRTPCLVENSAKPAAASVPSGDDPLWRLDMP